MFDCGYKSQYIGGQKEKFVRLDDFDSLSLTSSNKGMKKLRFNVEGFNISGHEKKNASKYFRYGVNKGSQGLMTIGRSLKTGVARAVFLEDLKVSEMMIFDPQHKSLLLWNRLLVMSCILSVSIDPLFFYLPIFNYQMTCLGMDTKLAAAITTMRTILDVFYLIRIALQFRTAYVAPSSRVFGRGELVIDPAQIASRYLSRYFIVDFLSVLPLPQIVVWKYLNNKTRGSEVLATKQALLVIVFAQYIPRFGRFFPLTSDLKKSAGSFAESVLAGAAYYLLWYLLASHIAGAFWYLLAIERKGTCWREACRLSGKCNIDYLYCGNKLLPGYHDWRRISDKEVCLQILLLFMVGPAKFEVTCVIDRYVPQNLKTYLQSLSVRLEEMRIKRRDSEQWMHHRLLPQDLRERVRRYDQYKWLETRGVDEENLVQSLPKDLRRDIKRHLCLNLVRRVSIVLFFGLLFSQYFAEIYLWTWRKAAELRRLEEEEEDDVDYDEENDDDDDERELVGQLGSAGLRATIFASRFAANALRGHKLRSSNSRGLKMLQKPPEPDFNEE
ncbi:hypothetical protein OIU78_009380 [Salix suchowensis]|nr:hypothetical protein OIU78_009380 [Salix suchowensis]